MQKGAKEGVGLSILPRPDGFSQKAGENHSALHLLQISISKKDYFHFFPKRREIQLTLSTWQPSQKSVDNHSASLFQIWIPMKDYFHFLLPLPASLRISCFCRILDICCDAGEWWGIPMVPWLKPILRTLLLLLLVTITKFLFLQTSIGIDASVVPMDRRVSEFPTWNIQASHRFRSVSYLSSKLVNGLPN